MPSRKKCPIANISQVVNNKTVLKYTPYRIDFERGNFYLVNGCEVPAKEFESNYPVMLLPSASSGNNCDKRKLWMQNKKSY